MPRFGKHARFIVHEENCFNGGAPLELLMQTEITPQALFFVRNHAPVPEIDPSAFRLTIDGDVENTLVLSLDELRSQFPAQTVTATLQCAGNRRHDLADYAPIADQLNWGNEAISSAVWTGVSLGEVLMVAGVKPSANHVAFLGLDEVKKDDATFGYGSSIPLGKALRPEALLAYEMNGEPLPAVHGFPLRVVVPGYIGARSVKWVTRITAQAQPSDNYYQAVAYKLFPPQMTAESIDPEAGLMLGELSVNSVICLPAADSILTAGSLVVSGYAMAGGERSVARVDVSSDGGKTWMNAELLGTDSAWTWRLWRTELTLVPGDYELTVRAWDTAANTQPEAVRHVWNAMGYMNNAWHRVKIRVV